MHLCDMKILQIADLYKLAVNFSRDVSGNIAMLFALMLGVLFLFVGGAVDYSRWNAVRTDMTESMDFAALAVTQFYQDSSETLTADDIESIGDQFFEENFSYERDLKDGWDVEFRLLANGNISACMNGSINTLLLPIVDIFELDMRKCTEITPPGSGRVELGLVLDVTGSMDCPTGCGKLDDLKDAVDELLDVLYLPGETTSNNIRIGVVPFNQHVNVGGASSWDDANWGDQNALSFYHGKRFIHVDSLGMVEADRKVNHYDLYNTLSGASREWQGCVEARPYPLDEMDTVPGVNLSSADIISAMTAPSVVDEPDASVRAAFTNMPGLPHSLTATMLASADHSRWVPVFLGDTVDCNSFKECENNNNKRNDSGFAGGLFWDGEWYTDPDSHGYSEFAYHYNRNQGFFVGDREITYRNHNIIGFDAYLPALRYFRDVSSGAVSDSDFEEWLDFNNVRDEDDEFIFRMGYVGRWNPLSSTYQFKYEWDLNNGGPNPDDCPPAVTPLTDDRTIIENAVDDLVADGGTNIPNGAVWGWRLVSPGAPFDEAIGPGQTGPNNTTFSQWQKAVVIMTDGNNDFADQNTHWGSHPSAYGYESEERMGDGVNEADSNVLTNDMEDEANRKLLRICRRMKEDNVIVYAIVFDVQPGSDIENIMRSCATAPGSPYFNNASDGEELATDFGEIAQDLVRLHVSQ